jgi:hypothetical protein
MSYGCWCFNSGAHPNRADRKGRTPLEAARANHHEAAALALVQAGAIERYMQYV